MTDFLVVAGMVTAEQIRPAIDEMREEGYEPYVVRLERLWVLDYPEYDEFREDLMLLAEEEGGINWVPAAQVRGLVADERVWEERELVFNWYADCFPNLEIRWVARRDGSVERV